MKRSRTRRASGSGHLVYNAESLKNAEFTLDASPEDFKMTTFIGPEAGNITSDHYGDGIDDLVVNEMLGDGLQPGTQDAGNLIVISGKLVKGLY